VSGSKVTNILNERVLDVSSLPLHNALKPSTPFVNAIIDETLRQFAPLFDYRQLQLFDGCEFSSQVNALL
jgi:hypothetical protein